MRTIVLAHGLEGRPDGTKATTLRASGLVVVAPDCRERVLAERVSLIAEALAAHPDAVLVGSSYGGLAALAVLRDHPTLRPAGLLLLAPALHWSEPPVDDPATLMVPDHLPAVDIHGTHDTVVPIAVSHALAARCPHVQLREVDDDHLLRHSLEHIVAAATELADR